MLGKYNIGYNKILISTVLLAECVELCLIRYNMLWFTFNTISSISLLCCVSDAGVMSLQLLWLFWTFILTTCTVLGNPDAKRLYDDLLSNYNKLVRPVVNTTDVLRVCIKLKLSQLIDVVSFPETLHWRHWRVHSMIVKLQILKKNWKKKGGARAVFFATTLDTPEP